MPFPNLGGLIGFDRSKLDKVAFRKWLVSGAMLLEPAVITPGNLDKVLFFDNIEGIVEKLINQVSAEDLLIVGGAMPTEEILIAGSHGDTAATPTVSEGEVTQYLSQFSNVSAEVQQIFKEKPHLVRRLQKFSKEDQALIVGNPLLLLALQYVLPILFQLLMNRFK